MAGSDGYSISFAEFTRYPGAWRNLEFRGPIAAPRHFALIVLYHGVVVLRDRHAHLQVPYRDPRPHVLHVSVLTLRHRHRRRDRPLVCMSRPYTWWTCAATRRLSMLQPLSALMHAARVRRSLALEQHGTWSSKRAQTLGCIVN